MTTHVPRKVLLPPYMGHAAWQDLADVIDQVFGGMVDPMIDALRYLRRIDVYDEREGSLASFVSSPVMQTIKNRDMIPASMFDHIDPLTDRLRLNQLGLRIMDPSILDAEAISRLVSHIGSFWYVKGLSSFIDFISYMLNTEVTYKNLWTQNYVNFYEEGALAIGTPIWDGGTWYPTTHVRLIISGGLSVSQLVNFKRLFYDIANYNLILESLTVSEYLHIVPASQANAGTSTVGVPSHIVGIGQYVERIDYIGNPPSGTGSAPTFVVGDTVGNPL